MNKLLVTLVLCTAINSPIAFAKEVVAPAADYVSFIGTGQFTCGRFIEYEDQGNQGQIDVIIQWAWGFLSAYNFRGNFGTSIKRTQNQVDIPDAPSMTLYLDNYCRAHPVHRVIDGVFRLINDAGGQAVWNKK